MTTLLTLTAWTLAGAAVCALTGGRDRLASLPLALVFGPTWIFIALEQTHHDELGQEPGFGDISDSAPLPDRGRTGVQPMLIDLTEGDRDPVPTGASR